MDSKVDKFLKKSKKWQEETKVLRDIILQTKLEEDLKWNLPCYTYEDTNIVIIQPFKNYLGLMFFKGAFLKDPKNILVDNGPNSSSPKRFEFRSLEEIKRLKTTIKSYIKEAIAIEDSGVKLEVKKKPQTVPDELKKAFAKKPALKKAFESLTPGRQRAYLMHFSSAKQAATREARIEKYIPKIMKGIGLNDR
ncbi:YdeI family protein [Bdellovibrio bacteriovorus]